MHFLKTELEVIFFGQNLAIPAIVCVCVKLSIKIGYGYNIRQHPVAKPRRNSYPALPSPVSGLSPVEEKSFFFLFALWVSLFHTGSLNGYSHFEAKVETSIHSSFSI